MKHQLFPPIATLLTLLTSLAPTTFGQTLLAPNLPSCATSCTVLQQAQTGCTPAGGAPVSNQATYQSCFCQSALLPSLYSSSPAQLCTSCSATDMTTIQNWYKTLCNKGAPVPSSVQPSSTSIVAATPSASVPPVVSPPPTGVTAGNQLNDGTTPAQNGTWISTHWQWVLMLVILFVGLSLLALGGWFFHRRYHRRREAHWGGASVSQPNINEWGPGQSVHDIGVYGAGMHEKGKGREQQPMPAKGRGSGRPF